VQSTQSSLPSPGHPVHSHQVQSIQSTAPYPFSSLDQVQWTGLGRLDWEDCTWWNRLGGLDLIEWTGCIGFSGLDGADQFGQPFDVCAWSSTLTRNWMYWTRWAVLGGCSGLGGLGGLDWVQWNAWNGLGGLDLFDWTECIGFSGLSGLHWVLQVSNAPSPPASIFLVMLNSKYKKNTSECSRYAGLDSPIFFLSKVYEKHIRLLQVLRPPVSCNNH